uniref:Uncharacterized protein n=1 Tax=Ananas comosus var. bracteatus TaxID=296719 RepID=A0A6V7PSW3_ANACO|nr:unnamed protein product [Ananas comosus var. bracteatus]
MACPVQIGDWIMPADLLVLNQMWGFDVILGIDWLSKYYAVIDCESKVITCNAPNSPTSDGILIPISLYKTYTLRYDDWTLETLTTLACHLCSFAHSCESRSYKPALRSWPTRLMLALALRLRPLAHDGSVVFRPAPLPPPPHSPHPPSLLTLPAAAAAAAAAAGGRGVVSAPVDAAALLDIRRSLRDLAGSDFFSTWDFSASSGPCASSPASSAPPTTTPPRSSASSCSPWAAASPTRRASRAPSRPPSATSPPSPTSSSTRPRRRPHPLRPRRPPPPPPPPLPLRQPHLRAVPPSLAGLPDLHTLDLGDNRLGGPIPAPPPPAVVAEPQGAHPRRQRGSVGEIPPEFSASQLLHLDLSRKPPLRGIPQLPSKLRYLSLSANSMSGPLDAAFSGAAAPLLPDLSYLELSSNAFAGPVPRPSSPSPASPPSSSSATTSRPARRAPPAQGAPPPPWAVVDLSHNALSGRCPRRWPGGQPVREQQPAERAVPEDVARSVFAGRMTTFYAQHNFLTAFPAPPLPVPDSVALCLSYNCMPLPTPPPPPAAPPAPDPSPPGPTTSAAPPPPAATADASSCHVFDSDSCTKDDKRERMEEAEE